MNGMKTILHLSSTSGPGGAEMIVRRLASSLDRNRFRSIVCLFRPGWLSESCQEAGLPTSIIGIKHAVDLQWARKVAALIRHERVSVIHAHEFTANVYGSLLGKLLSVPVVATIHGKNYYWEQAKRRVAYRWVSRQANLVAVSQDLKQFVMQRVGVSADRISVIYNGVEPFRDPAPEQVDLIREELGLAAWDHVIGAVGSLYPVKGHRHLLNALPAVLREFPKSLLLLVGRGDQEGALKEQAVELGIDRHVRFLGFRKDVPLLLSLVDLFVLPSLSEGLSMALLEAMAAGKPVVATRVGGNPELVEDSRTGFLVPSEDPSALAEGMLRALRGRAQGCDMGSEGKRLVSERFSFAGMVEAYQRYYDRV